MKPKDRGRHIKRLNKLVGYNPKLKLNKKQERIKKEQRDQSAM